MKKRILIIGPQGVGKTTLANMISAQNGLPIFEGVESMNDINEDSPEGIYTSNCISVRAAFLHKPDSFTLIVLS